MSVKAIVQFVENKSDLIQSYAEQPSRLRTSFFSGAVCLAFGAASGVPGVSEAGIAIMASPTVLSGLCQIAKYSTSVAKQYVCKP
jgi:hypothetical protein